MFALAVALPTWLALEGGGFDVVVRQQGGLLVWWALHQRLGEHDRRATI